MTLYVTTTNTTTLYVITTITTTYSRFVLVDYVLSQSELASRLTADFLIDCITNSCCHLKYKLQSLPVSICTSPRQSRQLHVEMLLLLWLASINRPIFRLKPPPLQPAAIRPRYEQLPPGRLVKAE